MMETRTSSHCIGTTDIPLERVELVVDDDVGETEDDKEDADDGFGRSTAVEVGPGSAAALLAPLVSFELPTERTISLIGRPSVAHCCVYT